MSDLRYLDAKNFRELHLLPRVIFSVGGIAFVGAFYVHSALIGLIGLATILIGVGLNLTVDVAISCASGLWWWGIAQAVACYAIAFFLIWHLVLHRPSPACPCTHISANLP